MQFLFIEKSKKYPKSCYLRIFNKRIIIPVTNFNSTFSTAVHHRTSDHLSWWPTYSVPSRRDLWSSGTCHLVRPPVHRSTVGGRAFPVAGPQLWNPLPSVVTSAPSLEIFRRRLKSYLFTRSYPDMHIHWLVFTVLLI